MGGGGGRIWEGTLAFVLQSIANNCACISVMVARCINDRSKMTNYLLFFTQNLVGYIIFQIRL